MKNLRRNFERFCYRHRDKGIPNLMLWIGIGMIAVYVFMLIDPSGTVASALAFDRGRILHGQIWRLISWVFVPSGSSYLLLELVMIFFYFQIGRIIESQWGALKFNLFYMTGIVLTDLVALAFGFRVYSTYLNLSLILSFATMFPENQVLLFFIIPLRMKYLAWFYFAVTGVDIIRSLLYVTTAPLTAIGSVIFVLAPLANYFLFFGSEIRNVFTRNGAPISGGFSRRRGSAQRRQKQQRNQQPNANWASAYQSQSGQKPYHHKCTVCGRTDTEYPDLEFRYCSRCNGYYCYCIDHINNHVHIQ